MKWHHYAGLIFGLVTMTWAFSGAMSLDMPFSSLHNAPPTDAQRSAVSGSPSRSTDHHRPDAARASGHQPFIHAQGTRRPAVPGRAGTSLLAPSGPYVYEQEIGSNDERSQSEPRPEHLIVSGAGAGARRVPRFSDDSMWTIAKAAMPGVPMRDAAWLDGLRLLLLRPVRESTAAGASGSVRRPA